MQCPPSPASSMALEIFGPEMADLQELLVSMAGGDMHFVALLNIHVLYVVKLEAIP